MMDEEILNLSGCRQHRRHMLPSASGTLWRKMGADPVEEDAATARLWALLEEHFQHHALLVNRFRGAGPAEVVRMWTSRTNEAGEPLSQFERDALVERHCELLGGWPEGS
jgi:hypothetical protein